MKIIFIASDFGSIAKKNLKEILTIYDVRPFVANTKQWKYIYIYIYIYIYMIDKNCLGI